MEDTDQTYEPESLTLNEYQLAAGMTAIYPRVYTEHQVKDICLALLDGIFQETNFEDEMTVNELLDRYETPFNRLVYPILGLVGEAGEMANKLKKLARDKRGRIEPDESMSLADELGDVEWYVSAVASGLEVPLGEVGTANLAKLFSRAQRGVLGGNGDAR